MKHRCLAEGVGPHHLRDRPTDVPARLDFRRHPFASARGARARAWLSVLLTLLYLGTQWVSVVHSAAHAPGGGRLDPGSFAEGVSAHAAGEHAPGDETCRLLDHASGDPTPASTSAGRALASQAAERAAAAAFTPRSTAQPLPPPARAPPALLAA